jgi:hypothetical protein
MPFLVTVRSAEAMFGTRNVWRRDVRVAVSDPSRTVIDVLNNPGLGGGIRHVAAVLEEYLRSEHRDDALLIEYGDRLGNRTVFKRLGWLLELLDIDGPLKDACLARRSAGLSKLDPTVSGTGRIVRRWGLRVNVDLQSSPDRRDDRQRVAPRRARIGVGEHARPPAPRATPTRTVPRRTSRPVRLAAADRAGRSVQPVDRDDRFVTGAVMPAQS